MTHEGIKFDIIYLIYIFFYLLWTLASLLVYSSPSALSWLGIVVEKSGLFWLFFIGKVILFLILVCSLTASFIANTLNKDCRTKPVLFIRKYYVNWQYKISAVFLILLGGNPKIWDTAFLELKRLKLYYTLFIYKIEWRCAFKFKKLMLSKIKMMTHDIHKTH